MGRDLHISHCAMWNLHEPFKETEGISVNKMQRHKRIPQMSFIRSWCNHNVEELQGTFVKLSSIELVTITSKNINELWSVMMWGCVSVLGSCVNADRDPDILQQQKLMQTTQISKQSKGSEWQKH